jgi:23S rRNA pseudouridine1911/1915/1917 synthase
MTLEPKIIFEDEFLVALDKPSGLVVNRSNTHSGVTLQDFVEEQIDMEDETEVTDFTARSGILHRLDKDTSGVILMAKDPDTFTNILAQFKNREISKEYKAIVLGTLSENIIDIDAGIKRNPRFSFKYAISPEGRESQTHIEKVKEINIENNLYTAVTVRPKTGRTHQIRVHCAALNHPVACDEIYCTRKEYEKSSVNFARLMLHAMAIELTHPKTGGKLLLKSVLPDEFMPYFK